ncbi:MAG: hypothetical protein OXC54_01210 [Rhodospirillaceae bacterium]|nr:hypothetical protein [Rhodospirillaceae bacterium]
MGRLQQGAALSPTHKGVHVVGGKVEGMRARCGRLFHARNMRWTSQALLAPMTAHDAMGGRAWTVLEHDDFRVCKAFALWANSTAGMIVHWTQGQRIHAGRSTTQIVALGQILCTRLDGLPDAALDRSAAIFDELAARQLSSACQAHADETRRDIDSAIVEILALPDGTGEAIEALRCREPSVHGQNREALAILSG